MEAGHAHVFFVVRKSCSNDVQVIACYWVFVYLRDLVVDYYSVLGVPVAAWTAECMCKETRSGVLSCEQAHCGNPVSARPPYRTPSLSLCCGFTASQCTETNQ